MHPVIDPVHIIDTHGVGVEVALIELVQVTGLIVGTRAGDMARLTHELERRISTHRTQAQRRRIIRRQILACRLALQRAGWSLEAQGPRLILTQHEGA